MKFPSAYLLVSHGSRDPRPELAMEALAGLLRDRLHQGHSTLPMVETAQLELHPLPLHQQITGFADRARAVGCDRLQILPLFLLEGVHVMEDIPAEIAQAHRILGTTIQLDLRPHLGSQISGLSHLLQSAIQPAEEQNSGDRQWIVLSHGSRRLGSNQVVEDMANRLQAIPAYWSISPNLEERMEQLIQAGHRHLGILPYFLFPGGITDAISKVAREIAQRQPELDIQLAHPIGATPELCQLILALTD
ncbi:sirohydrochlorin chelatase [Laspinema olomoucense]|uniref:sirohydrochlorin chelatase n=1 Tax=Laspinema olomoucense TaxID=3231600 RepID=UPI0021BA77ED|nr:sirohydrochlorin chelatase [Laspinema sp. D3c]MCT7993914.1 sirohydrochlorin chelatase [Laspinema sp. D3c]